MTTLDVRTREEAYADETLRILDDARVVFFSGGDQLRITSQIGGSPLFERIMEIHANGGMIAGTSAGAAAVPETMVYAGGGDESQEICTLALAPGLGLLRGMVIDVHFAERGRMERLLDAGAQNPKMLVWELMKTRLWYSRKNPSFGFLELEPFMCWMAVT